MSKLLPGTCRPAALNEELLKGNTCFGCGPDNPDGLRIRIFRNPANANRLTGSYRPRATQIGFPQIVHGGLQFTALDCMAAWTVLILRQPGKMMPITRGAATRFLKPACLGMEFALSSEVIREAAAPREPLLIRGAIRDAAGEVLTEVDFEYLLLPQERFLKATGLAAMPDSFRRHFGEL
jgi:acyl-coenzyme A thioesterase PaaI-like protein